jgi:hypothetical protein
MKSLKICVSIVAELITNIGEVLEDKKVKFGEVLSLLPFVLKIPNFVSNLPEALEEIKNGISDEYFIEINQEVSKKLNLPNEKAEIIVENCVKWIIFTSSTVIDITNAVKK